MERITAEFIAQRQEEATQTGVLDFYLVRNLVSEDLLPFPEGLKTINMSCTAVKWLPELPEGLEELRCDKADLTCLPCLPSTLKVLHIRRNWNLTKLPELSEGLEVLDMWESNVEVLPKLPKSLKYLQIGVTYFRELLEIPPNLEFLDAGFNMMRSGSGFLERLGPLPSSLKYLSVEGCSHFTSLGPLHEGLESLHINSTGISVLPVLPESLIDFSCDKALLPEGCNTPEEIRDYQGVIQKKRTMARCATFKEELIAAVQHPRRMEFWSQQE